MKKPNNTFLSLAPFFTDIFNTPKVLVLGGTGFVGSEVCRELSNLGVSYISTSRDGRDGTSAFDVLNSADVAKDINALSKGCTAVISTIGSINTSDDYKINAASGIASTGAKKSGVKNFIYISVSPEVRDSVEGLPLLKNYMAGKVASENTISENFSKDDNVFCIIQPTFIYGGDEFNLNPPRVTKSYGSLIEGLLSLGIFRFLASNLPGLIGVAFRPPIPVETVAKAAVAFALNKASLSCSFLDTYDSIVETSEAL